MLLSLERNRIQEMRIQICRVHTQMTYINMPDDENLIWVLVS